MKRQWKLRRELTPVEDGQRRWDQAYQHLLRWARKLEPAQLACSQQTQEVYHEESPCTCGSRPNAKRKPRPSSSSLSDCALTFKAGDGSCRKKNIFRDDGYSGASLNRPGLGPVARQGKSV